MALLVAFIGWLVLRYTRTYLHGEPRARSFHALMLATLATVIVVSSFAGRKEVDPVFSRR